MAANDITVRFGAEIAGLVSGVQKVEDEIKGLRVPIDSVVESFRGIGEAIGAAFVIDKIAEFTEKMGELGEHAENMAATIGVLAQTFQALSDTFKLVGGDGDSVARSLRLVSNAVEQALGNPASRQADAFRQIFKDTSITVEQFAKTVQADPVEALKVLADRFKALGGAGGEAGGFGIILGRQLAAMVPYLKQGREGIEELFVKNQELGALNESEIDRLAKLQRKPTSSASPGSTLARC